MKTQIVGNQLVFDFNDYYPGASLSMEFVRTLRIPDDGKSYGLPPGIGHFPIKEVDAYKNNVPPSWIKRGGVFIPMFQAEAMYIAFRGRHVVDRGVQYPFAIRMSTGKVSALTGELHTEGLKEKDYMVVPGQPWLDGFVVQKGVIRQFIATPMGAGFSVEKQVTGKEDVGGFQIEVIPMKKEEFESRFPVRRHQPLRSTRGITTKSLSMAGPSDDQYYGSTLECFEGNMGGGGGGAPAAACSFNSADISESVESFAPVAVSGSAASVTRGGVSGQQVNKEVKTSGRILAADMAMAAGGTMSQEVLEDSFGLDTWDQSANLKLFLSLADAQAYPAITGEPVPHAPPGPALYKKSGFKWYTHYESGKPALNATETLAGIKGIADLSKEKGWSPVPDNTSVDDSNVQHLKEVPPGTPLKKEGIRDGEW